MQGGVGQLQMGGRAQTTIAVFGEPGSEDPRSFPARGLPAGR